MRQEPQESKNKQHAQQHRSRQTILGAPRDGNQMSTKVGYRALNFRFTVGKCCLFTMLGFYVLPLL